MENIEYSGPNGYTIIERNVLSPIEKMARENTSDLCGVHRCFFGKSHGSKRMVGFNPRYKDTSENTILTLSKEHKEKLMKDLENKRMRETVRI